MKDTKITYLNELVELFNVDLRVWEDLTDMRANFGFRYDSEGRKEMYVMDTATVAPTPTVDQLEQARTALAEAGKMDVTT